MPCNEITNQVILAPTYAEDAEGAIQKMDSLQYRMVVSSQTSPLDEDNVRLSLQHSFSLRPREGVWGRRGGGKKGWLAVGNFRPGPLPHLRVRIDRGLPALKHVRWVVFLVRGRYPGRCCSQLSWQALG